MIRDLSMPMLLAASAVALGASDALAADGAKAYAEHCATCHDTAGAGVPGFGPALAGPAAARIKARGGREYLAQVVVNGITGIFEQGGQRQLGVMPSFAALSDADLAAALNHVLVALNPGALPADFRPIADADIAAARTPPRAPRDLHRTKEALERATP